MDYNNEFEREEVLALQEIQSMEDGQSPQFISVTITTTVIVFWSTISNYCGAS